MMGFEQFDAVSELIGQRSNWRQWYRKYTAYPDTFSTTNGNDSTAANQKWKSGKVSKQMHLHFIHALLSIFGFLFFLIILLTVGGSMHIRLFILDPLRFEPMIHFALSRSNNLRIIRETGNSVIHHSSIFLNLININSSAYVERGL